MQDLVQQPYHYVYLHVMLVHIDRHIHLLHYTPIDFENGTRHARGRSQTLDFIYGFSFKSGSRPVLPHLHGIALDLTCRELVAKPEAARAALLLLRVEAAVEAVGEDRVLFRAEKV